jgi:hypothetical protein
MRYTIGAVIVLVGFSPVPDNRGVRYGADPGTALKGKRI